MNFSLEPPPVITEKYSARRIWSPDIAEERPYMKLAVCLEAVVITTYDIGYIGRIDEGIDMPIFPSQRRPCNNNKLQRVLLRWRRASAALERS